MYTFCLAMGQSLLSCTSKNLNSLQRNQQNCLLHLCRLEQVELHQKFFSKRKICFCMLTGENKTTYIYKMFMSILPSFTWEIFSSFQ